MSGSLTPIDSEFDVLPITLNEPFKRKPKTEPHCDCRGANAARGRRVPTRVSVDERFEMVPTSSKDGATCDHSGYYALQAISTGTASQQADLLTEVPPDFKGVEGVEAATGRRLYFKSAEQASLAGFGSIAYAIKSGAVLGGWRWRRVGKWKS